MSNTCCSSNGCVFCWLLSDEDEVREYESFKNFIASQKSRQQEKVDKQSQDNT